MRKEFGYENARGFKPVPATSEIQSETENHGELQIYSR
jgi:hypothetical protein